MKVAAVQMVSTVAREANLARRATRSCAKPLRQDAELAVLARILLHDGKARHRQARACERPAGAGTVQGFLADAAREFGLWIVGGTLPLETGDETHVFNSSLAYSHPTVPVRRRATTRSICSSSTTAANATTSAA